jgi:hypothetical protein
MHVSDKDWLIGASCVFVLLMLVVEALLASAGERVTVYAMIAALTLLPALYSSRARRIWGVIATLVVLGRLTCDHQAGKVYRRMPDMPSPIRAPARQRRRDNTLDG